MELMRAMEEAHERAEHDALAAFETAREEIKNRDGEEYNALKFSLEAAVEALEKHFEEAHRAYVGSTDTRAESFKRLTRQDATSAKTIERRMRRLIRLREQLAAWRVKAETNRREWEARNSALRREKERVSAHYHALAESMRKFRAEARRKLSALIADATSAGEALDEKIAKAERLLTLGRLSRRLETEAERVAPFDLDGGFAAALGEEATEEERAVAAATARVRAAEEATRPSDGAAEEATRPSDAEAEKRKRTGEARDGDERPLASAEGTHEHGEGSLSSWGADASGAPVPEHEYLERFFNRRNRAFLSERAIDREQRRLDRENEDLRAILKQYLDGVSVNEDVIGDPANPLFVVNDKVLRRQAERRAAAERGGTKGEPARRGKNDRKRWKCSCAPTEVEDGIRGGRRTPRRTRRTRRTRTADDAIRVSYEGTKVLGRSNRKQPKDSKEYQKSTKRVPQNPKEYRLGIPRRASRTPPRTPPLLRALHPSLPSRGSLYERAPPEESRFRRGRLSLDDAFPSRGALDPRLDEGRRLERHRLFAPGVFRLDDRQPALARESFRLVDVRKHNLSREDGDGNGRGVERRRRSLERAPPRSREVYVQATRLQVRTPIGRDEFKKSGAVSGVVFAARVEREGHLARRQRVARRAA